jgi:hypothetical protein
MELLHQIAVCPEPFAYPVMGVISPLGALYLLMQTDDRAAVADSEDRFQLTRLA